MLESEKRRRWEKNRKCYAYIAAFIVFQTIIIVIFSLTVLKIKNPNVKLKSVVVQNLIPGNQSSPSFSMNLVAELTVKNKNFGHFKFDNSTVTISYNGETVGDALIPKGKVKAKKTKKMTIYFAISSNRLTGAAPDLSSGTLTLTSHAKLTGKVHLMKLMKKRKTPEMNCTMNVVLATGLVQGLRC